MLWTNDPLAAARRIYLERGFRLVDEERHHSFGADLVGQNYALFSDSPLRGLAPPRSSDLSCERQKRDWHPDTPRRSAWSVLGCTSCRIGPTPPVHVGADDRRRTSRHAMAVQHAVGARGGRRCARSSGPRRPARRCWSRPSSPRWSGPTSPPPRTRRCGTPGWRCAIGDAEFGQDLRAWVDGGLMTLFFLVVGLEARREFDLGDLRERRRFVLPLAAGVVGMAVPVGIFLLFNAGMPSAHGWGVAMSTDTALALGPARDARPPRARQGAPVRPHDLRRRRPRRAARHRRRLQRADHRRRRSRSPWRCSRCCPGGGPAMRRRSVYFAIWA